MKAKNQIDSNTNITSFTLRRTQNQDVSFKVKVVASEHAFTQVCCSIPLTAVYLPALKKTHRNPKGY